MLRRTCLFASSLLLTPFALAEEKVGIRPNSVPSHPEYEELRAGTQIEHLYESMLANGFGIKNPDAKPDEPTVVIVSDTQCPWCSKLWHASLPLQGKVNFVWFPIPVLNDLSLDQAALILSSKNPWAALAEHEEHFKDPDFRGINPAGKEVDKKFRAEVWSNAKIARWSGLTVVPLGVFKNKDGKYLPIFSGTDARGLEKIIFGK